MSNVRDFGAIGDGRQDDAHALQHAIDQGDGTIELPRGDYLISRTITVDTTKVGRQAVFGSFGTAKVIMAGAGPAFRLIGNHAGSADPGQYKAEEWRSQRMPTVTGIEIEGRHREADGIELAGTSHAILSHVLLRELRHGVRVTKRNRNIIVEGCHIYHNTGVGLFLDGVNLHQINVVGNHISYNRLGGLRIERSEIRNLQITGNDIEYNTDRTHGIKTEPSAEIYIDVSADGASVDEVTIASNTIQARPRKGGCNIRVIDDARRDLRPGFIAISGNVIGNQTTNVHLTGCEAVTITGNTIYGAIDYTVLLEQCREIVLSGNQSRRHGPKNGAAIRIVDSTDCVVGGSQVFDESDAGHPSGLPSLAIAKSRRVTVSGCHFASPVDYCVDVSDSSDVVFSGCSIHGGVGEKRGKSAIRFSGEGSGNLLTNCHLRRGTSSAVETVESAGLKQQGNLEVD